MGDFYPAHDNGIETDAPVRRRVGHEIELDGERDLAYSLAEANLSPGMHDEDCRCEDADDFPIHDTEDCTADAGEFLIGGSKGVLYGSPAYYEAVDTLCSMAQVHDVYVGDGVGGHVHVDLEDVNPNGVVEDIFETCLLFEDELFALAAMDSHEIRHNQYMTSGCGLQDRYQQWNTRCMRYNRAHGTFEFRVWNSCIIPHLLHMSAGVSVGIVEAAIQHRQESTLLDTIAPFCTDKVLDTAATLLPRIEIAAA